MWNGHKVQGEKSKFIVTLSVICKSLLLLLIWHRKSNICHQLVVYFCELQPVTGAIPYTGYNNSVLELHYLWKVGKPSIFITDSQPQIRSDLADNVSFNQQRWSKQPHRAHLFAQSFTFPSFSLFVTWIFNQCHEYWMMLEGKTPVSHFKSQRESENNFIRLLPCLHPLSSWNLTAVTLHWQISKSRPKIVKTFHLTARYSTA